MQCSLFSATQSQDVIALFKHVFAASEGEAEGEVIAEFVASLIATTDAQDLIGFTAQDGDTILGCIFFSRMIVPSGQIAFILSPVAVSTDVQGRGVGRTLIQYGLEHLKQRGVELAFTYGDPNYYAKTGFRQIDEATVPAPCPLSQPIGWLAQSLNGEEIQAMTGVTQCVEALNDPDLW